MGQPTVIIGSAQVASELLDARGSVARRNQQRQGVSSSPATLRQYLLGQTPSHDGW